MSGPIPPLPPYACMAGTDTALPLRAQNAKFFLLKLAMCALNNMHLS